MNRKHRCLALLFLFCGLIVCSTNAWANIAANTQIINSADLAYDDGTGIKHATASVTVTVSLIPSAPNIAPGPPQTTSYTGAGTTLSDSFTITTGANGPDTYNLAATVTGSTNTSGATATSALPTVALGATVTTAGSTTTIIVVPADGNLPGEMTGVNGIQVGDTVVIGSDVRTVTAITDNPSGTSTIVLNTPLGAAPGVGVLVAEQKVLTVNATAGTITTTGINVTVSDNITATSTTLPAATTTSGALLNTFTSGVATLAKYVRNLAPGIIGSGTPYTYNSINYYPAGVTAKPGNVLEYILVATNTRSSAVTSAVISDILPTDFVTLKAGVYGGKEVTYVSDANVTTTLTAASDGDAATYDAPTKKLTVNVGDIAGSNKFALVLYQVTVNP
jgi:hypothetical protein